MILHARPDQEGGVLAVAEAKIEVGASCEENEERTKYKKMNLKPLPLIRA